MTTLEMEVALSKFFNPQKNLIVPNVSWGMFTHECDLIVVGESGLIREVEIKVSKSDLINDADKRHNHDDNMISRLYFAIPAKLIPHIEYIPNRAGIITVERSRIYDVDDGTFYGKYRIATLSDLFPWNVNIIRPAKRLYNYHINLDERIALMRLANMRIWGLKKKIIELRQKVTDR